jgi:hypothetical protein
MGLGIVHRPAYTWWNDAMAGVDAEDGILEGAAETVINVDGGTLVAGADGLTVKIVLGG